MARQLWWGLSLITLGLFSQVGCEGSGTDRSDIPTSSTVATGSKKVSSVAFVGFDASPPLVEALHGGKLQGLVLQNPLRMGELGVKAAVAALEKSRVESKTSTGETLATPDNMGSEGVAPLLNPTKAENAENAND